MKYTPPFTEKGDKMAKKYWLVNESVRLIHVFEHAVVPGDDKQIEIEDKDNEVFKATVKDVPGLRVLNEKAYQQLVDSRKAAASNILDDDDEPAAATVEPKVEDATKPADAATAWKS